MILRGSQIEDSDERLKLIAQFVAFRTGAFHRGAIRSVTQSFHLSDFAYVWQTADLSEGIRTLRDDVFQAAGAGPRREGISNRHFVEDIHELRQMLRGKDGRLFAPLEFAWKPSTMASMPEVFHALLRMRPDAGYSSLRMKPDAMDDCSANTGLKAAVLFGLALGQCQRVILFDRHEPFIELCQKALDRFQRFKMITPSPPSWLPPPPCFPGPYPVPVTSIIRPVSPLDRGTSWGGGSDDSSDTDTIAGGKELESHGDRKASLDDGSDEGSDDGSDRDKIVREKELERKD